MAYQLQPGMKMVQDHAVPAVCATEEVFVYPQPSFNKVLAKTYERNFHPLQNVECKLPLRTQTYEPSSTRAEMQNGLFQQRYLNKNLAKK